MSTAYQLISNALKHAALYGRHDANAYVHTHAAKLESDLIALAATEPTSVPAVEGHATVSEAILDAYDAACAALAEKCGGEPPPDEAHIAGLAAAIDATGMQRTIFTLTERLCEMVTDADWTDAKVAAFLAAMRGKSLDSQLPWTKSDFELVRAGLAAASRSAP